LVDQGTVERRHVFRAPRLMAGIGVTELLIVLGIVLLIFGPKRLPMLGRQIGGGMREFRDSITKRHEDAEREDEARAELPAPAEPRDA
jgi:TatA/E family protein of Tat protein translocase